MSPLICHPEHKVIVNCHPEIASKIRGLRAFLRVAKRRKGVNKQPEWLFVPERDRAAVDVVPYKQEIAKFL